MALELNNLKEIEKYAKKLHDNGIVNLMVLASTTVNELATILGTDLEKSRTFIEKASKIVNTYMGGKDGFITGDDLLNKFNERMILSTKCPSFDKILDGGFETQKVYEVYGKEGTGKSSLMLELICLSHLPVEDGGLGSPCTIYIDTEGSFSIKRLKVMAPYYKLKPEEIVKSVVLANPPTSDAMLYLCEKSLMKIMDETGAKLIILDSLATHFRSEYYNARNLLPERQGRANRIVHSLKKATRIYNALAVMTNQATANVTGFGAPYSHAMGLLIGHEAQVRIRIAPDKSGLKKVTIEKAVDLPNLSCLLELSQFGFIEPSKKKKSRKKKGEEEEEEVPEEEGQVSETNEPTEEETEEPLEEEPLEDDGDDTNHGDQEGSIENEEIINPQPEEQIEAEVPPKKKSSKSKRS